MALNTLHDLYVEQLRDLYSAETQLVEALPAMASAASHDSLRAAFHDHLEETQQHVIRLEQVFIGLGVAPGGETCEGMKGLLKEAHAVVGVGGDPAVRDAALIAAAQRVEHYEIAGYGTVSALADQLDLDEAKDMLDRTLDEEGKADKLLTKLASGGLLRHGITKDAAR
jgi:ferritin-like metal-binding protein YciE